MPKKLKAQWLNNTVRSGGQGYSMQPQISGDQESQEPQESTTLIGNESTKEIKGLSSEAITLLLKTTKPKEKVDKRPKWQKYADGIFDEESRGYPAPQQIGPLRRKDQEMRCASRNCNSPTYYKFQGIPYCSVHVVRIMNEMLVAKGVLS